MNRIEIKAAAREQIRGNLWKIFLVLLVVSVISWVVSSVTAGIETLITIDAMSTTTVSLTVILVYIIQLMLMSPLELSVTKIFLNLTNGIRPNIGDVFWGFNYVLKSVAALLRVFVFTFLWSLLFVIPGIVKAYSYSMTMYIIAENPQMSAKDAMKESMRIMNGHEMELFILHLSFFGWILLSALTFGILLIYVAPYMEVSVANFYKSVKNA